MESSKHTHKRKRSHNHHQNVKKSAESVSSSSVQKVQEPIFGKEIESGRDSELCRYVQNVLGPYDDYRSAISKVPNMNEQMYGVAEPQSAGGQNVQPVSAPNLKREKLRKKQQDCKVGDSEQIDMSSGRKKASVAPYKDTCQISTEPSSSTFHYPHSSDALSSSSYTSNSDGIHSSTSHSATLAIHQPVQSSTVTPSPAPKERKKMKKIKRKSSPIQEPFPSDTHVASSEGGHLPNKTRPRALDLPVEDSIGTSGPDTGDIRHMLQELLNPQSVSLVTPIPTPNKVKPFTFPTHQVFKVPSFAEATHADSSILQKPSINDHESSKKSANLVSADDTGQWGQSSSSGSSSSSASSSASSRSSSPSSVSTTSSREHSPSQGSPKGHGHSQEGGPRLTLEMLQQQIAPSNLAAITPLKKTPPHLMGSREELANLSPAKSFKSTVLSRSDPTMSSLATQSSLGFHPIPAQHLTCSSSQFNDADSSESSSESSEMLEQGHLHRPAVAGQQIPIQPFITAQEQQSQQQAHRKKPMSSHPGGLSRTKNKKQRTEHNISKQSSSQELDLSTNQNGTVAEFPAGTFESDTPTSLLVKIPLTDFLRIPKPKATVEPYNIRMTTPHRRNTGDTMADPDMEMSQGRDRYPRLQNVDYSTSHDFHRVERSRVHPASRWERDRVTNMRQSGRGHGWEREHYYRAAGGGDDYWSDAGHYDSSRESQRGGGGRSFPRKRDPEYFMQEARRRKKEADKIMVPGLAKAKLYMESVTYFMRHGGAIENEQQSSASQAVKRNPYKMYSDTVSMIKYCQNMAGECKPLLVLCLRCQSALYWRMFLIKQPSTGHVHKELQEFFIPPKSGQRKSPFLGGLSPLPSPASVGSTASSSSAGGSGGTASHSADSTVPLPRHIYNKAADHLTVSALVYTCLDLWRLSDSYMQQCREFFLNADRKAGLTIHYYSPVFQVASWVENILKSLSF